MQDIGEYTIGLNASLEDPDETISEVSFTLTVIDSCSNSILNSDNALVLEEMVAPDDVTTFESI